ncbi:hypothetical protein ACPPVU_09730 [Mucilaginibacter sp. McL0603]|uniref:hypothetical protein n=1 Tax=Mucilaginibacter sp. McL0603 TaxID=3415670 RepID=UPI003CEDC6E2
MKKICFLFLFTLIAIQMFAQNKADTISGQFHDDLLDHLVGKWNVTSIAHGSPFTSVIDAKWVLNHQYLHVHLKSNEVIPWWHVQMEYDEFIGYNHNSKRYVVHGMSIEGDEDLSEGFCYGYRTGNEFKVVAKFGVDSLVVQRFTWEPASVSWNIKSNWVIAGKEGEVFLEMKLVAAKPSSKKNKPVSK